MMYAKRLLKSWKTIRLMPIKNNASAQEKRSFGTKKETKPFRLVSPPDWHRPPSTCATMMPNPCIRKCFDINSVTITLAWSDQHKQMVHEFLHKYYWPREPLARSLFLPSTSHFVTMRTDYWAWACDSWLAFEWDECCQCRLVGVLVGSKVTPCTVCEYEEWGNVMKDRCEKFYLYLLAHCYQKSHIHKTYHAPYFYDLSVIATIPDVQGQGVGTKLMQHGLTEAHGRRYSVAVPATSAYLQKIMRRLDVPEVWSLHYRKYLDPIGRPACLARAPHHNIAMFCQPFEEYKGFWGRLADEIKGKRQKYY